jgi:hypothetical protein
MSNELALPSSVPEHLRAYYKQGGYREDIGRIDPSDVGTVFLKLVHGTMREAMPGWDGNPATPGMQLGTMFLSNDRKIVPVNTPIYPLYRTVRYIRWQGKPGDRDSKIVAITGNREDPRILAERGLEFKEGRDGKTTAPLWTTYTNVYVAIPYANEPVVISFYRTSTTVGRNWTRALLRATQSFSLPLYTTKWLLGQPKIETDGKNHWAQIHIVPAGFTEVDRLKKLEALAEDAKFLVEASTGADFLNLEDSPLKQARTAEKTEAPDEERAPLCDENGKPIEALPEPTTVTVPSPVPAKTDEPFTPDPPKASAVTQPVVQKSTDTEIKAMW